MSRINGKVVVPSLIALVLILVGGGYAMGRGSINPFRGSAAETAGEDPPPEGRLCLSQMTVEIAARDELGQRQLGQPRSSDRGREEVIRDRLDEARGQNRPADANRRREQRARTADVGHVLGGQRLQCSRRRVVIPEVRVVVVLDYQPVPGGGPLDERPPALRSEGHAERKLVIGAEDDGGHVGHLLDAQAPGVDGNRYDLEPAGRDRVRSPAVAGVLDTDPPRAAGAKDGGQHEHGL